MIIPYSSRQKLFSIFISLAFLAVFIVLLIDNKEFKWYSLGHLFLSIWYFLTFIRQLRKPKLEINEKKIILNEFPTSKTIVHNKLNQIKYSAGDFIITDRDNKQIRIVASSMTNNQKEELQNKLKHLEVEYMAN